MSTFRIHESNIDRLTKKLTRIRNKCHKYGCDFHYEEVGEEFVEYDCHDKIAGTNVYLNDDKKEIRRFIIVEAEGTAKVNGWQFAATIDHTENGNIVRKMLDTVEIPERYYYCEPTCEHCKSKRHRKDTYIVYNEETHEFKQVGSSCLCDFTGGYSAELAASYIAMYDELIEGEAPADGCDYTYYFDLDQLLRYAYYSVKHLGYVSTSAYETSYGPVRTTREDACDAYLYDNSPSRLWKRDREIVEEFRDKYHPDYTSEEAKSYVEEMLEYFKNNEESGDYMHNLKVLANTQYIKSKEAGYVVSMIATYNKHLGKIAERKARDEKNKIESETSNFIGEVGKRIVIDNIDTAEAITSWGTQYGTTTRYKITDKSGNIYMWDSSTGICLGQHTDGTYRNVVSIIGTVKKYDEFRGIKQTWLTRCKVTYSDPIDRNESQTSECIDSVETAVEDFLDYCNG